jgi:hypothetical protein
MGLCATNCSNRGSCIMSPDPTDKSYMCNCSEPYYVDATCSTDARPCSAGPCLNNATCSQALVTNTSSVYKFTCTCKPNYNGMRCETFDMGGLCANLSCTNGVCKFDKATSNVFCSCFPEYAFRRLDITAILFIHLFNDLCSWL